MVGSLALPGAPAVPEAKTASKAPGGQTLQPNPQQKSLNALNPLSHHKP